jgi:transposase
LRNATYAIEDGDTVFAPGFRHLLLRAVTIGKRHDALTDTTLAQYHADLDRRLGRLLPGHAPTHKPALRLFRAIRREHNDLFRFVTRRDVPYTSNACGCAPRPSVNFRKVTNCFSAPNGVPRPTLPRQALWTQDDCMGLPRSGRADYAIRAIAALGVSKYVSLTATS